MVQVKANNPPSLYDSIRTLTFTMARLNRIVNLLEAQFMPTL